MKGDITISNHKEGHLWSQS